MALRINKDGYKNNYSRVSLQNLINPPFMLMWQNAVILNTYTCTHMHTLTYTLTHACSQFTHRMKKTRSLLYLKIEQ